MGITRPSLYAAFGNKEALFKRALDLYETEKLAYVGERAGRPTARGVAQRMLEGTIANITSECPGCLGVIASVSCSSTDSPIRDDVRCRAQSSRAAMVDADAAGDRRRRFHPAGHGRGDDAIPDGGAAGHFGPGRRRRQP